MFVDKLTFLHSATHPSHRQRRINLISILDRFILLISLQSNTLSFLHAHAHHFHYCYCCYLVSLHQSCYLLSIHVMMIHSFSFQHPYYSIAVLHIHMQLIFSTPHHPLHLQNGAESSELRNP